MKKACLPAPGWVVCVAWVLGAAGSAEGQSSPSYYVSTGQSGALASIDVSNTQYWEFSLANGMSGFAGGNFVMKRGGTTESISFNLYQGSFANRLSSTVLMSVTLPSTSLSNSFTATIFSSGTISLAANTLYTITLTSNAATNQSYAIKGGTGVPLGWVDSAGNSVSAPSGATITNDPAPIPAPGAAAAFVLGALGARSRRRRS